MSGKLVLGLGLGFAGVGDTEQLETYARAGWEGTFTGFNHVKGNFELAKKIRDNGLYYQSIHADFVRCDRMWEEGIMGDWEMENQIRCVRHAATVGVDLVVMHAIIGFNKHEPNQIGIDRFGQVFEQAKKVGVKVALENTEGQEYLDALLDAYKNDDTVRFCIDTGHEMCYNESRDLIGKFADKLQCTHLNDNMKITGDIITWKDDAHMVPFDGLGDWEGIARRLKKAGYNGDLTFELTRNSQPERNTHAIYSHYTHEEFVKLCYDRAVKFKELYDSVKA